VRREVQVGIAGVLMMIMISNIRKVIRRASLMYRRMTIGIGIGFKHVFPVSKDYAYATNHYLG